jgi:para-nitrobenzyl esterase
MIGRACTRLGLLLVILAVITACSVKPADTAQPGTTDPEQPNARSALAGTEWQLVEILSMDDQVYAPEDRSLYTLVFSADGSMRVRADCNLGTGTWTSESAGLLQFGRIAATQALCPPDSLHDRYMGQFPWVRSYVMKDGRLFLATMADGSIIEFEPIQEK